LQALMGHESPKTTAIYTQLTDTLCKNNSEIVNAFVNRITMPDVPQPGGCRNEH